MMPSIRLASVGCRTGRRAAPPWGAGGRTAWQRLSLCLGLSWGLVACSVMQGGLVARAVHPFHISTAEMEWNAGAKCCEVGLKLQPSDLERALSRLAGKRVRLEDEDVDGWIEKYLQAHFRLTDDEGRPVPEMRKNPDEFSRIKVVGKEIGIAWMWIYFELRVPAGKQPKTLVNSVLMEVNDAQINTVSMRSGPQRRAIKLTARQWWHPLNWEWLTGERKDRAGGDSP